MTRLRGDAGAAVLEFVLLSVLLLVPLLYLLLSVFRVQAGAFAVTQAAREAGRAYAVSPDPATAGQRAAAAARLAFEDQGVAVEDTRLTWTAQADGRTGCAGATPEVPELRPGRDVLVCVTARVRLPFADRGLLGAAVPGGVSVSSRYVVAVDPLRAGS